MSPTSRLWGAFHAPEPRIRARRGLGGARRPGLWPLRARAPRHADPSPADVHDGARLGGAWRALIGFDRALIGVARALIGVARALTAKHVGRIPCLIKLLCLIICLCCVSRPDAAAVPDCAAVPALHLGTSKAALAPPAGRARAADAGPEAVPGVMKDTELEKL